LFAASEVRAAEYCGLAAVSSVAGLARSTIERGLKAAWRRRLLAAAFAVKAAATEE
jgi:lambda repressor-like predicted transcriptional regulator